MGDMVLLGRLHPLLVHFPIGLVILAALAEAVATVAGDCRWRTVAVANVRAGAASGVLAAIAGWRLALAPGVESSALLGHIDGSAQSRQARPWRPRSHRRARTAHQDLNSGCSESPCSRRRCRAPSPDSSGGCWVGAMTLSGL